MDKNQRLSWRRVAADVWITRAPDLLKELQRPGPDDAKVQYKTTKGLQETCNGVVDPQAHPHGAEHHHTQSKGRGESEWRQPKSENQTDAGSNLQGTSGLSELGHTETLKLSPHSAQGETARAVKCKSNRRNNLSGFYGMIH